ncbi:hypothetical protein LJ725_00890 [Reyranella aquatilis]|uniref:Lipoprotein n=1 Tax=Reyranella aquatilis TaxID=2035356 RepID=A0ABS8KP98_9HYPH|nr:hypothetical protein [Reyranella aquatilis]MCC8427503.1 hypothetical protein [Reyranella aquatilis]
MISSVLLLAACNPAERMSYQVKGVGTGYDTIKEDKIPGGFRAQGVHDPNEPKVSADEVKWRTLYNGLQSAQNAGYDLTVFAGPASSTLTITRSYSFVEGQYPGFVYIVRGYKSDGEHPASARPIAALMDEANRRAFAAKKP